MKNIKGFTLIELLAVIIILGILMIIAIPSVTKYISDSRKEAYIKTAKQVISATKNLVNSGKLEMYDINVAYYISNSCIKVENGEKAKSPYGEFVDDKTYVIVTYDGKGYDYYWISLDDTGTGVRKVTSMNELDVDDIESDLTFKDIEIGIIFIFKKSYAVIGDECSTYTVEEATYNGAAGVIYKTLDDVNVVGVYKSKLAKIVHENGDIDYRYQGGYPKNYIIFNNETWRIVGIFDGRLKIVPLSLLQNKRTFGSTAIWDSSEMKEYLNTEFYDSIQNDYKKMIDENVVWYLAGPSTRDLTKEQFYLAERNELNVSNGYSFTSNTTKIGLIYPSDYGYSVYENENDSDSFCPKMEMLSNYGILKCKENNWLKKDAFYTISHEKGSNKMFCQINQYIGSTSINNSRGVLPTLYLKPSVKIISGDGNISTPYILSYE